MHYNLNYRFYISINIRLAVYNATEDLFDFCFVRTYEVLFEQIYIRILPKRRSANVSSYILQKKTWMSSNMGQVSFTTDAWETNRAKIKYTQRSPPPFKIHIPALVVHLYAVYSNLVSLKLKSCNSFKRCFPFFFCILNIVFRYEYIHLHFNADILQTCWFGFPSLQNVQNFTASCSSVCCSIIKPKQTYEYDP